MGLPTTDEFLASLNRMRADSLRLRDQAIAEGDKKTGRAFEATVRKVEAMILKKGGQIAFTASSLTQIGPMHD